MSSTKRQFMLTLAALPLAGCGFTPAYAPGGAADQLFDQVGFDAPSTKNAFDLVERLEERLGRTKSAPYQMAYQIKVDETGLAVTPDNATTRYRVLGTVTYTLTDTAGTRLAEGKVQNFTAYSATGTVVASRAAREDAYLRLMRLLADAIVTRLIASGISGQ